MVKCLPNFRMWNSTHNKVSSVEYSAHSTQLAPGTNAKNHHIFVSVIVERNVIIVSKTYNRISGLQRKCDQVCSQRRAFAGGSVETSKEFIWETENAYDVKGHRILYFAQGQYLSSITDLRSAYCYRKRDK